jgi:hypothetical protein
MSFPTGRRLPRQRVSAFDRDTTEKLYGVFYPQTRQTLRRKAFRGTPGGTRTPNLLIRSQTDPVPTSTTLSR